MTFERPEAWWLAALAVPIVVLHLHLRRRRRVEVSSLELWRGLVPDRAGRGGLRQVRDALALAMLLAALVALTASAAGPVTGAAASEPRRLAIVVDRSVTMNTRMPDGQRRIDRAVALAVAAVRRLGPKDELTVWSATSTPFVAVEPTTGRPGARELAALLDPTLEPSGVALATRLAIRAAPGVAKRPATVLVLTDPIGAATLTASSPAEVGVEVGVIDADRVPANASIIALDIDLDDPARALVRVAVTDGAPSARSVVLSRGTAELARAVLTFDADRRATAAMPLGAAASAGGLVEVRLEPSDDFSEDDSARMMLPVVKALAVAVVAESPSPFLVEALRAMPGVVDPARTTLVAPGAPASAFDGIDVVVADGAAEPAGRPALVFGGGARVVEQPLLWGVGSHPVLMGVDLSPLRIESAALVDPAPGETTIVSSAAGAVGVAGERGGVRRVVLGFRPDASTLPLEAAFPLLVRNAVRWLGTRPEAPRFVVAGEPASGADGAVVPYPAPGGPYALLRLSGAGTTVRWTPPREFRLSPLKAIAGPSAQGIVASLPDRSDDVDSRVRHAPRLAALGAALLVLGALLLGKRRAAATAAPPSTGTVWATSTREAERSTLP